MAAEPIAISRIVVEYVGVIRGALLYWEKACVSRCSCMLLRQKAFDEASPERGADC